MYLIVLILTVQAQEQTSPCLGKRNASLSNNFNTWRRRRLSWLVSVCRGDCVARLFPAVNISSPTAPHPSLHILSSHCLQMRQHILSAPLHSTSIFGGGSRPLILSCLLSSPLFPPQWKWLQRESLQQPRNRLLLRHLPRPQPCPQPQSRMLKWQLQNNGRITQSII